MLNRLKKVEQPVVQLTPNGPKKYPNGTFLRLDHEVFFVNKELLLSVTDRVLESWRPAAIAPVAKENLVGYQVRGRLGFRNGSLISTISDGRYYLIENGLRRHITNPDWIHWLGYETYDAILVSEDEALLHAEGEVLN